MSDWSDWFVGDDSAGWGNVVQSAAPAASDSVDWGSYFPQETYGYNPYSAPNPSDYLQDGGSYGGDLVGGYSPQQSEYTYTNQDVYGPPIELMNRSSSGGIWNTMQDIGRAVESPGGKLGVGLFGAGVSAYGANKANKQMEKARKRQEQMLRERQAKSERFSEKANVGALRQAVAPGAVQRRGGESVFFADNRLPVYSAEGGSISEEDWLRMQEENNQGIIDARMDRPSMMGFLRYMAAGKRMPSEIAAAKRAQHVRSVPEVVTVRNRALRDAATYDEPAIERAAGGSSNYVQGDTPGQADQIPARLSDGEYVFDADSVAALGDGNNAAGAKKLDQMRQSIRTHKRSAPANKIPPKAKSPLAYMKKGAK